MQSPRRNRSINLPDKNIQQFSPPSIFLSRSTVDKHCFSKPHHQPRGSGDVVCLCCVVRHQSLPLFALEAEAVEASIRSRITNTVPRSSVDGNCEVSRQYLLVSSSMAIKVNCLYRDGEQSCRGGPSRLLVLPLVNRSRGNDYSVQVCLDVV